MMGSLVDYRVGMGGCGGDDELLRKHKGIGDGAVFGVVDDWLEGSVKLSFVDMVMVFVTTAVDSAGL